MGKPSRDKGKRGEREVVAILAAAFPDRKIRRGWQSRQGTDEPDVVGVEPFWVEVKRGKRCNWRRALQQAIEDAGKGLIPVAVTRDDGGKWTVHMLLEDAVDLFKEGVDREI